MLKLETFSGFHMTSNVICLFLHNCHKPLQQERVKIPKSNLSLHKIKQTGRKILQIDCNAYRNLSISDFKLYDECGREINHITQISNNDHIFLSNGIIMDLEYELLHLCVLGEAGVGKSALTYQYIEGIFVPDFDPTLEDAYRKEIGIDGNPELIVDILDTAGCDGYICLRSSWMRYKDGFILVFAINDKRSFEALESFYDQLCELYEDDVPPFIIVGNKVDIENNMVDNDEINIIITYWYNLNRNKKNMIPVDVVNIIIMYYTILEREVMFEEGINLANKWNAIRYIETSARTGYNVENMCTNLVRYE